MFTLENLDYPLKGKLTFQCRFYKLLSLSLFGIILKSHKFEIFHIYLIVEEFPLMGMETYSLETSRDNHMFGFNPSLLACPEEKQPSRKSWRLLSIKKLQAVYCQQCPSTFPMPPGQGITSGCSEVL